MRVISGKYKRALLPKAKETCRPTKSMVREAIFSMLGSYINAEYILDLFCGTGSMGIEAASRGAKYVLFLDSNKNQTTEVAAFTKKHNVNSDIWNIDYRNIATAKNAFDLIFIDPPYDKLHIYNHSMELLSSQGYIKTGTIIVMEIKKYANYQISQKGLELLKEKVYGKTKILIYVQK